MVIIFGMILMHILGDYYLQTNKIALGKTNNNGDIKKYVDFKYLNIHSVLYAVPFCLLFFVLEWSSCLFTIVLILVTHWLIDFFSCWFRTKTKKTFAFILDQTVHIVVLLIISKLFIFNTEILIGYEKILYGITIIAFLVKPSIIIVNNLFEDIFVNGEENININKFDVGAIIGVFERIIILVLSIFNAIVAIAIIVTVKTWARSNDIKNIKDFGNKYLVGTLVSISLALIASYVWSIYI